MLHIFIMIHLTLGHDCHTYFVYIYLYFTFNDSYMRFFLTLKQFAINTDTALSKCIEFVLNKNCNFISLL